MLKIAICDDQPEYLQKIDILLGKYLQTHPNLTGKVETFNSGTALLNHVEEQGGFDLYILDILMPGQNGIAVGKYLRRMQDTGELIFLTSSNDYAADSYDVQTFFYLLKPVEQAKFFRVLDKVIEKLTQREERAIIVETLEGPRRLLLETILYGERVGKVIRYYCINEIVDSRTVRTTFRNAVSPLLEDKRFYLCGASFVLNFQHVAGVNGHEALLDNGTTVPLPRTAAIDFKRAWGNYWLTESHKSYPSIE